MIMSIIVCSWLAVGIKETYFYCRTLMKHEDAKVANYSSMVIYNILLGSTDIRTVVEDSKEILEILLDNAAKNSEFA